MTFGTLEYIYKKKKKKKTHFVYTSSTADNTVGSTINNIGISFY